RRTVSSSSSSGGSMATAGSPSTSSPRRRLPPSSPTSRLSELPVAVGDAAAVEVVGREFDLDAVSGQDADAVAPHPARDIAGGLMAVVKVDSKQAVSQRLADFALQLDLVFLDAHQTPVRQVLHRSPRGPSAPRAPHTKPSRPPPGSCSRRRRSSCDARTGPCRLHRAG